MIAHPIAKPAPVVIKVGGSLLDLPQLPDRLAHLLATVRQQQGLPVLISGGGKIVDEIRRLDSLHSWSSTQSHELAIRAMELTAHLLKELLSNKNACVVSCVPDIQNAMAGGLVPIVAPWSILHIDERSCPELALPHSWDTTSDSIAGRIATLLNAQAVILAKSTLPPAGCSLEFAAQLGIVDPILPQICNPGLRVAICNLRDETIQIRWLPDSRSTNRPPSGPV